MIKKAMLGLMGVLILGLVYAYLFIYPKFPLISGYAARMTCTCAFVQGRTLEDIENTDLFSSPINLASNALDYDKKEATSSVYGMAKKTAVYRPGLGCVLLNGEDNYQIKYPEIINLDQPKNEYAFVKGKTKVLNDSKVQEAENLIFDKQLETRAVLILHNDTLIYEKYAPNFDEKTPFLGWSMTKSVTSTLIGILVKEGKMDINEDHLFKEWANDERANITILDLLHQQSGIDWEEDYTKISDATKMLYGEDDMVSSILDNPLEAAPGTYYEYSSANTNLLSGLLRERIGNDEAYLKFPKERLFDPLGMHSAFIEPDESGTFVGSSYMYANARDWLKYGKLYLNKGNWSGNQIISSEWVERSSKASEVSNGLYGLQFWQNDDGDLPDCPRDMYYADGYQGQRVYILPSQNMVVVRFGLKKFDENTFVKKIVESVNG